mmetsp:Transcript_17674/g.24568  ORF Transcript_17674/g.24568 Transcript_17674/m.24568 type:complete len:656 (-) Transcript_17674:1899-3866(-)
MSECDHNVSMDDLNDDVLHHILSFISSAQCLARFALTSRRVCHCVYDAKASSSLFDKLYEKSFGRCSRTFLLGGRRKYESLHRLRQCLRYAADLEKKKPLDHSRRRSIGVLSSTEESEAILYDSPHLNQTVDVAHCIGYFSCQELPTGPVVITGDFNGIRIAPSLNALLEEKREGGEDRKVPAILKNDSLFQTIAGDSQVLAVVMPERVKGSSSYFFFLGFALGPVMAVQVDIGDDGKHTFTTKSISEGFHSNEVAALTLLPMDDDDETYCLISGCVDGQIYFYAHSSKGVLDDPKLVTGRESCFSLCSTRLHGRSIFCIGENGGISFWERQACEDFKLWGVDHKGLTESIITRMRFAHQNSHRLVMGTNTGKLCIRKIAMADEHFFVTQKTIENAHSGTIETVQVSGNVLLTCGGDGHVKAWDLNTGSMMGMVNVHPGRLYPPVKQPRRRQAKVKSAVVSTLVRRDNESLVSLCRDGTIYDWNYGDLHNQVVEIVAHNNSQMSYSRSEQTTVSMSEADIKDPNKNDVLLGSRRKRKSDDHPGNLWYHTLVNERKIRFLNASGNETRQICNDIIHIVRSAHPPGRFLAKEESIGMWYDVGDKAAMDKTYRALWEVRRKQPEHTAKPATDARKKTKKTTRGRPRKKHQTDEIQRCH